MSLGNRVFYKLSENFLEGRGREINMKNKNQYDSNQKPRGGGTGQNGS
jgi:hypothetical protein